MTQTFTDQEIEQALLALIAQEAKRHSAPTMAFTARELSKICCISPRDVIDLTRPICKLWSADGEKFLDYTYLGMYLRVYGASDVEMDFDRADCGPRLIDLLLQREGGAK